MPKQERYNYKKMWMSEKAKKLKLQDELNNLNDKLFALLRSLENKTKPWQERRCKSYEIGRLYIQ